MCICSFPSWLGTNSGHLILIRLEMSWSLSLKNALRIPTQMANGVATQKTPLLAALDSFWKIFWASNLISICLASLNFEMEIKIFFPFF